MKFEKTDVWGFEHSLRGMRNPLNSHWKSDSQKTYWNGIWNTDDKLVRGYFSQFRVNYTIGEKDMELAQRLIKAGTEHRKFLRQIFVSVDITAPLYWWKEMDQYRINVTTNSTSSMHKLASTPITMKCFETDDYNSSLVADQQNIMEEIWTGHIECLENLRQKYLETKDKKYWKELIRLLPESWLQTRTITMNYENIRNMYSQRRNHKLTEWSKSFVEWVKTLPYVEELIMYEG